MAHKEISVMLMGNKAESGRGKDYIVIPIQDLARQRFSRKQQQYFVDRFLDHARNTPTNRYNVQEFEEDYAKFFVKAPTNVRLPDGFKRALGLSTATRDRAAFLVKEGLVTKKQAEYCLALIDEFKPDLEEFIDQLINVNPA